MFWSAWWGEAPPYCRRPSPNLSSKPALPAHTRAFPRVLLDLQSRVPFPSLPSPAAIKDGNGAGVGV